MPYQSRTWDRESGFFSCCLKQVESAQRNPSLDLTWVQHSSFNKHPFGRDAAARSMSSVSFIASSQLAGPLWPCSPSMLKVHLILTTKGCSGMFRLSGLGCNSNVGLTHSFYLPCHAIWIHIGQASWQSKWVHQGPQNVSKCRFISINYALF